MYPSAAEGSSLSSQSPQAPGGPGHEIKDPSSPDSKSQPSPRIKGSNREKSAQETSNLCNVVARQVPDQKMDFEMQAQEKTCLGTSLIWMLSKDLLDTHGTLFTVTWQPGWERGLGENGFMIMYHNVPLLFT